MEQHIDYERLIMLTRTSLAMLDVMHKILWELFAEELASIEQDNDTDWEVLETIAVVLLNTIWPEDEDSSTPYT